MRRASAVAGLAVLAANALLLSCSTDDGERPNLAWRLPPTASTGAPPALERALPVSEADAALQAAATEYFVPPWRGGQRHAAYDLKIRQHGGAAAPALSAGEDEPVADRESPREQHERPEVAPLFANVAEVVPAEETVEAGEGHMPGLLLPDLQVLPPDELYVWLPPNGLGRTLNFSTVVVNAGNGPLILQGRRGEIPDRVRASQIILHEDGSSEEHPIGEFVFHREHEHWHLDSFVVFELWTFGPGGALLDLLRSTGKMSFCIRDSEPDLPMPWPEGLTGAYEACDTGQQGLSAGWADRYGASIPGQSLVLGDLPDGEYALRLVVDPEEWVTEMNDRNNAMVTFVQVNGMDLRVIPYALGTRADAR